jgi:transcription-repair coupling factor (superfamily II helicase)
LRLQLYRRLAGLTTIEAIAEIGQEFTDRFGPIPEQVWNLLYIVRVKVLAINAGVEAIGQEEEQLLIKSAGLETLDRAALQDRLTAQGVPARAARRGIWLDLRSKTQRYHQRPSSQSPDVVPTGEEEWQQDLVKTLEALTFAQARRPPPGAPA